jgi:hypothetical protein
MAGSVGIGRSVGSAPVSLEIGDEQGLAAGRAPDVVSEPARASAFPSAPTTRKARCPVRPRVGTGGLHVENGVAAPTRVHTIPKGALIMVIGTRFSISTDGYEESND